MPAEVVRLVARYDTSKRWLVQQTIDCMTDDERRELLFWLTETGEADVRISEYAIPAIGTDATPDPNRPEPRPA